MTCPGPHGEQLRQKAKPDSGFSRIPLPSFSVCVEATVPHLQQNRCPNGRKSLKTPPPQGQIPGGFTKMGKEMSFLGSHKRVEIFLCLKQMELDDHFGLDLSQVHPVPMGELALAETRVPGALPSARLQGRPPLSKVLPTKKNKLDAQKESFKGQKPVVRRYDLIFFLNYDLFVYTGVRGKLRKYIHQVINKGSPSGREN